MPVDARMTGIYLGAGSSLLWYLLLLRAQESGRFTRGVWTLLAVGIGVMALDGLNSLAVDLRLPAPYTTTNLLRLVTGLLAGVAIGTLLSHLATISLVHRPPGGWRPASATTLAPPLAAGAFICAVTMSALPTLALPLTCLIVASVVAVLWAMTSVLVALALGRSWGFASSQQRDETLAISLVLACVVLAGLAVWRAFLERLTGPIGLS